jgi:hypothetical protein
MNNKLIWDKLIYCFYGKSKVFYYYMIQRFIIYILPCQFQKIIDLERSVVYPTDRNAVTAMPVGRLVPNTVFSKIEFDTNSIYWSSDGAVKAP